MENKTKFCKFCGATIAEDAIVCTACGRQVETIATAPTQQPSIIINNSNMNSNVNTNTMNGHGRGKPLNKWIAFFLCLFLGFFGAHKFYEGKVGMGIVYLFTGGLFCIGWMIDMVALLFKPNPYYA